MKSQYNKINVCWFRRDLRLDDNTGLAVALNAGLPVLCLFIFDTNILNRLQDKADKRVHFIHDQVVKLHESLTKRGSGLFVGHDKPESVFNYLFDTFSVQGVFTNRDYSPYALHRDQMIEELCQNKNIEFHTFKDHVFFEPHEVLKKDRSPYTVFTPYSTKWKDELAKEPNSEIHSAVPNLGFYEGTMHDPPSLSALGFEETNVDSSVPGIDDLEHIVTNYHETRDLPALQHGTTRLGIHLRFGTLSIRRLVRFAAKHNETFLNELIWREFFQTILYHYPNSTHQEFKSNYRGFSWSSDEENFDAWKEGRTGYPIVDAGMRELNATGFMHNRVRMIVASFLCKHLLLDWRLGERYFAQKLLDYELASNVGNWQWASGTGCDAAPYFRVFNPYRQTERFDPELAYVKKWVPELDDKSYPEPIVDHKQARLAAIDFYKKQLGK